MRFGAGSPWHKYGAVSQISMRYSAQSFLFSIALGMLSANSDVVAMDSRGIAVNIQREGETIVVDVDLVVDATPQQVWDVMTDYDHMARFVSSVAMSRIVGRTDGKLEVAQSSRFGFGPFALTLENVREIEFVPWREIHSTLVRGDMKASAFTTRIVADGDGTRITNHGRFTPDRWIPPVIGSAVLESATRKQFAEFRAEILRRKDLGPTEPR
jgi:uncharacterized protein YndB with AHSA1/START domain